MKNVCSSTNSIFIKEQWSAHASDEAILRGAQEIASAMAAIGLVPEEWASDETSRQNSREGTED